MTLKRCMLLLCSSRRSLPTRLLAQWNLYCLNGAQENGTNGLFPNRAERRRAGEPSGPFQRVDEHNPKSARMRHIWKSRGSKRGRIVVTPRVAAGRLRRRSRPLWAAFTRPQHACGVGRSQAGAGRVRGSGRTPQLTPRARSVRRSQRHEVSRLMTTGSRPPSAQRHAESNAADRAGCSDTMVS